MEDKYKKYEDFEGPTEEELRTAYKRMIAKQNTASTAACGQGSGPRIIGTPRHAKHRGSRYNGVPMK